MIYLVWRGSVKNPGTGHLEIRQRSSSCTINCGTPLAALCYDLLKIKYWHLSYLIWGNLAFCPCFELSKSRCIMFSKLFSEWWVLCKLRFLNYLRQFEKSSAYLWKELIPRHHVYFSSGGTIFKNEGLQSLQLNFLTITQCFPEAYAKQWHREIIGFGGENSTSN